MQPSEVQSSQDVRDHWDEWSYNERVEALDQLANETLDQYAYDEDVDVDTGDTGDVPGNYDDDTNEILLDPELIEDPSPERAIHVVNHETVHAMNDEDGIDDYSYDDDGDFDFEEGDLESFENHGEVGDIARELDRDGFPPPAETPAAGGTSNGGSAPAAAPAAPATSSGSGESGAVSDAPKADDVEVEIDWSEGVWIETVDESGAIQSVDILYAEPEGW